MKIVKNQAGRPLTLVERIVVLDKKLSAKIQVWVLPVFLEYFLYLMANIFNRKKAIWALFFVPALACYFNETIALIIANPEAGPFDDRSAFSNDLSKVPDFILEGSYKMYNWAFWHFNLVILF